MEIAEIQNKQFPTLEPIKENMNIIIPNITVDNIPNRNGAIVAFCGSGGSGKTSLLLNFFKKQNKGLYYGVFSRVYYICPSASFHSVKDHPFEGHRRVYHELTPEFLYELYDDLEAEKNATIQNIEKQKLKKKQKNSKTIDIDFEGNPIDENGEDDDTEIKYNCVIIDDMASSLKNPAIEKALNKLLIKSRHINTMFITVLQSYLYFPKILRKQITDLILFKSKNWEEFESIAKELFNLKKDDTLKLYDYIYDVPYNHLDFNTITNTFFKNFNRLEITTK